MDAGEIDITTLPDEDLERDIGELEDEIIKIEAQVEGFDLGVSSYSPEWRVKAGTALKYKKRFLKTLRMEVRRREHEKARLREEERQKHRADGQRRKKDIERYFIDSARLVLDGETFFRIMTAARQAREQDETAVTN